MYGGLNIDLPAEKITVVVEMVPIEGQKWSPIFGNQLLISILGSDLGSWNQGPHLGPLNVWSLEVP